MPKEVKGLTNPRSLNQYCIADLEPGYNITASLENNLIQFKVAQRKGGL